MVLADDLKDPFWIAVDFDGTIVRHAYPEIGEPVPGAVDWLKLYKSLCAGLILWTMRSGDTLSAAEEYMERHGVRFDGVNVNPTQAEWTDSAKAHAHVYIDDAAFGCPVVRVPDGRPYVDWMKVGPQVMLMIPGHEPVEAYGRWMMGQGEVPVGSC